MINAYWSTLRDAGSMLGLAPGELRALVRRLPPDALRRGRGNGVRVHVPALVAAMRGAPAAADDPLFAYRSAKATLAELEVAERRGEVVAASRVCALLDAWGAILADAATTAERAGGTEALAVVIDVRDRLLRAARQALGDEADDASSVRGAA